jgi:hypothetical protein
MPSLATSWRHGAPWLALIAIGATPCAWAKDRVAPAEIVAPARSSPASRDVLVASSRQGLPAAPVRSGQAVVAAPPAPVACASLAATARLVARYRQLGGPLSDIASGGSIGSSKARRELAAAIYRERLDETDAVQRAMQACGHAAQMPPQ